MTAQCPNLRISGGVRSVTVRPKRALSALPVASSSHQLEALKGEHGLFDNVILGLSLRMLFFLNIGNTIRFFRVVN